jgi:hypothetical protein
MIERTIRTGQWWADAGNRFEVIDKHAHDIHVRYADGSEAWYLEADFEDFTPL